LAIDLGWGLPDLTPLLKLQVQERIIVLIFKSVGGATNTDQLRMTAYGRLLSAALQQFTTISSHARLAGMSMLEPFMLLTPSVRSWPGAAPRGAVKSTRPRLIARSAPA